MRFFRACSGSRRWRCSIGLALRTPVAHQRFDGAHGLGHGRGQVAQAALLEEERILDADADSRVLADRGLNLLDERQVLRCTRKRVERRLADVDAWLDGK